MSSRSGSSVIAKGSISNFEEVYRGANISTIYVIVPGIGTSPLKDWSNGDGGIWLSSIPPTSDPNIAIYCFIHNLRPDDSFSWDGLFDRGAELLDGLVKVTDDEETSKCPIILISHSLGGVIVKEAVALMHQQAINFQQLWRSIAGAIFLGTPHTQSDDPRDWENACAILRLHSRSKNFKLPLTDNVAKRLARVSLSFEQAFDLLPVLSAFEARETRTGGFLSAKTVLVGEDLAKTNVRLEKMVRIDADHNKICCFKIGSQALKEISTFLETSTKAALGRIQKGSNEYVLPPALDQRNFSTESPLHNIDMTNDAVSMPQTTNVTTYGSTNLSFDIIPLVSDFTTEMRDPVLPCHIMPPYSRNRSFFGRGDIIETVRQELLPDKRLATNEDAQPILKMFAICGPGGIGKTQVATEFVHSCKSSYDGVFWVQADERSKLSQGYTNIALGLGLVLEDSTDARDPIVVQDLVKGWLANPVKTYNGHENAPDLASWLLIFDNVDDPDILDDFWPFDYAGTGAVLITSRDPLVKTYVYSETSGVNLPPFTTDEATEFLLKLTHREGENMERLTGTAVAQRLGGLPLALTQMAGVIERRDLSFSEFLRVFEEEDARSKMFKMQLRPSRARSGYEHTLDTVWALEKLSEGGAFLLDVLSLFDPDGISEHLLECFMSDADFGSYPKTEVEYQEARAELQQSSLIARDRVANRITIHRLVQDGARSKMTPGTFKLVFDVAVQLLSAAWPFENFDFGHGVSRWTRCAELFPHIIQLHRFWPRVKKGQEVARISEVNLQFPRLLCDAARFNHQRGNSLLSTTYLDTAESACKNLKDALVQANSPSNDKLLKAVKTLSAEISHDLGCIATETNQPEAAFLHFQSFNATMLEFSEGKPQNTDRRLAVSWNELGNAHMMKEEWKVAEECFKHSLEAMKQLDSYEPVESSFPVINLGFSYWLQGRLDEAEETLQEMLAIREAKFGLNDKQSFITGKLLHAYGNVKAAKGELDESFEMHSRALQQYKATIGVNHHRTADLCIKVSDHLVRLGEYQAASSLIEQALKIYGDQDCYGPERARALFKQGNVLQLMGSRLHEREKCNAEALNLYRELKKGVDLRLGLPDLSEKDFDDLIVFWSK